MEVKALKSFATVAKTASQGEVFSVESEQFATDLIEAGYVEEVKKRPAAKKTTPKGKDVETK